MNGKMTLAVILISVIIFSPVAVVVSQTLLPVQAQAHAKGGQSVQDSALAHEVAPAKKPPQGIATGTPIELSNKASRLAIIIGISDYAGTVNDLNYCDNDAIDFKNALLKMGWSEGGHHHPVGQECNKR